MGPFIVAGAALGGIQTIAGLFGANKAKNDIDSAERNRPIYTRPDEAKQSLDLAKTSYNSQMPGTTQFNQGIQQATQGGLKNLENSGEFSAGAVNDLYRSQMGALNNLAMQQSQYHVSQQDQLTRALSESAKYSDQEYEYNINSLWQRKYQNAINRYESNRNMTQAGLGTMANAFSNMGDKSIGKKTQAVNTMDNNGDNRTSNYV